MAEPLKPPFIYFGGKTTIAERVAALLPPHEHYVEPFAGSLAVLLAKPPSRMETANDLNGDLVTFWRVLRDRPDQLARVCALTPHSRAEYAGALDGTCDELERARRVWVRLTQGRAAASSSAGWRYHQNARGSRDLSVPGYLRSYVGRMAPAAERMAMVTLECRPALEVIAEYGRHPNVLIYADPPYVAGTRDGGRYLHEMTAPGEHRELLESLLGCRAAVVLSGYASPLYDGLLANWSRHEIDTRTGNGGDSQDRAEVLWSNRPLAVPATLFDLAAG